MRKLIAHWLARYHYARGRKARALVALMNAYGARRGRDVYHALFTDTIEVPWRIWR